MGGTVFISYSHRDEAWKDRLVRQLQVLELEGAFDLWDDRQIAAGDDWRAGIEAAMDRARAAILLISADFLISGFIRGTEVPRLLQLWGANGLRIIPLIVHPCAWQAVGWLAPIQCRPKDGRPLSRVPKGKAEEALAALALEVQELLKEPSPPAPLPTPPAPSPGEGRQEEASKREEGVRCHPEGEFYEQEGSGGGQPSLRPDPLGRRGSPQDDMKGLRFKTGTVLKTGVVGEGLPLLDIGRLPVPGQQFVGRQADLARLDAAWADPQTHVLTLVAFGGVGKSALVARWMDRMAAEGWRGAARVLDWSFYSQGMEDRVTSAEPFIDHALRFFGDDDPKAGSLYDRGARLARLIRKERSLLVLDGVEPLQYPPGRPEIEGRLKDPGLTALLKGLAGANPGLCVVTTRERLADLAGSQRTAPQVSSPG